VIMVKPFHRPAEKNDTITNYSIMRKKKWRQTGD